MGVVGVMVNRAGQMHHPALDGLGSRIGWFQTPEAMGQGGSSVPPVSLQYASGVSHGNPHEFSRLVQGHLLRKQVVENLESRLFFGLQYHILHGVNVTFLLAS